MDKNKIPFKEIPTEDFSLWLEDTKKSLLSNVDADVPCGECNACCRSSYFIHVRPDDTEALAHIPKELLFPAPGLPKGNMLLGYDEKGACPMLVENQCSIYQYRPTTCRRYDCRILAATGLTSVRDDTLISNQAQRWKFNYPSEQDVLRHSAVKKATHFLLSNSDSFPAGFIPANEVQQAILAIKVYEIFLDQYDNTDESGSINLALIKTIIKTLEAFDRQQS